MAMKKFHLMMKPVPSHLLQPPLDSNPPPPMHLGHISVLPNPVGLGEPKEEVEVTVEGDFEILTLRSFIADMGLSKTSRRFGIFFPN